ncbi:MAG: hypothetical protein Q9164_005030, partial [Protoblastenia rupestris]
MKSPLVRAPESYVSSELQLAPKRQEILPEVYPTNAPENLHGPRDFPPEALPCQGLETIGEHLQLDEKSGEGSVGVRDTDRRWKKWSRITIVILIVGLGAVGGAVGGALGKQSNS